MMLIAEYVGLLTCSRAQKGLGENGHVGMRMFEVGHFITFAKVILNRTGPGTLGAQLCDTIISLFSLSTEYYLVWTVAVLVMGLARSRVLYKYLRERCQRIAHLFPHILIGL